MKNESSHKRDLSHIRADLEQRLSRFRISEISLEAGATLRSEIEARLLQVDPMSEGYRAAEIGRQRDLSVRFHWGHNHDFGEFFIPGRMGWRHVTNLAEFMHRFDLTAASFAGRRVLDIGCWTGGTALLLVALGSRVVALEEVRKYASMTAFLARSFGLEGELNVRAKSVFECGSKEFRDSFEIVHCPGVLYHVSDPIVLLRILFNALSIGGIILLESRGLDSSESVCAFNGSLVVGDGSKAGLDRGGWTWFVPSPTALERMMTEAGFEVVQTDWDAKRQRIYSLGRKSRQAPICRAGLSVPGIR